MLQFFFILCAFINCKAEFELFAQSSLRVYTYRNYGSTTVSNYKITPDVNYASFRFGSRVSNNCDRETIHVYIRFGSLPIVDPKNLAFPNGFVINNQNLYHIRNLSTKFNHSINIASPLNGYYFVVAFLHPKYIESNTLWNKNPKTCKIWLTTSVYVQRGKLPLRIQFNKTHSVFLNPYKTEPLRYVFIKPKEVMHAELTLRNINFLDKFSSFVIKVTQSGISHSIMIISEDEVTNVLQKKIAINCLLEEGILYGINFFSKDFVSVSFDFEIGILNPTKNTSEVKTQEYNTYKVRRSNPSTFFFNLLHSNNSNVININTSKVVTVLFVIRDGFDIGGTLSFRVNAKLPENQQVIVCINNTREIPMKPNFCVYNEQKSLSPMVLNASVKEAAVHIPYPLPGIWYASFTLVCFMCKNCKKFSKFLECPESKVTFTLASYSCFEGRCANGGICVQKISQGCVYSVCTCYNRFKGWTCSNGSDIVSPQMIRLELFLLLSSLLTFLVAGYIGFKRKYYEESTVFVIQFFSSSLSHSCQSGKYLYNLCIFDRGKLVTTQVYCGFLTIWVTAGAVACLRKPLRHIFHMVGAVLVAFCVIQNDPEWIYLAVISFEILVGIINWSYQNVMLHLKFPSNLYTYVYLPSGIVIFCCSMLIYVLLEKESNYMYLHSLSHILLGFVYILLIPDEKYIFPTVQSHSSSRSRRLVQSQISDAGTNVTEKHWY